MYIIHANPIKLNSCQFASALRDLGTCLVCRQAYGGLYGCGDFHHRQGEGFSQHGNCQIQGQDFFSCNDCVQQCDLGGLADLDSSQASVQVFHSVSLSITRFPDIAPSGMEADCLASTFQEQGILTLWLQGSMLCVFGQRSCCGSRERAAEVHYWLQGKVAEYLNRLAALGVAGVRVDAAKHINHWDLGSILQVRHLSQ